MNIVNSLIAGVVIGWLASIFMRTASREGLIRNVAVAVVGAYVGGWLMSTLFETVDKGGSGIGVTIAACVGATVLLLLLKRFSRA